MIESVLGYIDQVLYEFQGQLSITDIKGMTYKELGLLRKHRTKLNIARNDALENAAKNPK